MAYHFGFFHHLYREDTTRIGFFILGILLLTTLWVGKKTYSLKKNWAGPDEAIKEFSSGWFIAESCLVLGLIGTVTGFILNLVTQYKEKDINKNSALPSIPAEGENTFHFQRVWVDEQLENFGQLLNDARIIPTMKDEKPYFMFQYIKEKSIYEKLGLKPNDIILEINGFPVDTVGKALRLLEVLQSEREISLKVEREEEPVQFHYFFD